MKVKVGISAAFVASIAYMAPVQAADEIAEQRFSIPA